jgi:hypothetical protein
LPLVAPAATAAAQAGIGNPHDLAWGAIDQHRVLGHVRHQSDDEENHEEEGDMAADRRERGAADAVCLLLEEEVHFPRAGHMDGQVPGWERSRLLLDGRSR